LNEIPRKKTDVELLAEQVAELAEEVKELKALLAPIPSFILTGQKVLAEFERLQQKGQMW
jgi:cob(I)alamin adenosyltransferase